MGGVNNDGKAIIVDLDGTLCNIDHRIHLLVGRDSKEWHKFEDGCISDGVNGWAEHLITLYKVKAGYKILLVTGRTEKVRGLTEEWLLGHCIPYDELYMRPEGEDISDCKLKEKVYKEHIAGKYIVEFVVEDRKRVVEMWRRLGLTCLACAEGDY